MFFEKQLGNRGKPLVPHGVSLENLDKLGLVPGLWGDVASRACSSQMYHRQANLIESHVRFCQNIARSLCCMSCL